MTKTGQSKASALYSELVKSISRDINDIKRALSRDNIADAVSLLWAESNYKQACKLAREYDFNGRLKKLGNSLSVLKNKIKAHPGGLEAWAYACESLDRIKSCLSYRKS